MPVLKQAVDSARFNPQPMLPFNLRISDFQAAMQDVYDFFFDVNTSMEKKGLPRIEAIIRKAIFSGTISDMLTASIAKHARTLVKNEFPNGHPDLIPQGKYPKNATKQAADGIEIKATKKAGGAVDHHGARSQWLCVFVYEIDEVTEPAINRLSMRFTEVYLSRVGESDFRKNARNTEIGTRTATLDAQGLERFRKNWIYLDTTPRPQLVPPATAQRTARARRTAR